MTTEKELVDLNYGPDLKNKLEQLGIGDAWEDGKKKSAIIADALTRLAVLQSQLDLGATTDQAKKKLEDVEEGKKLAEQEKEIQEGAIQANADAMKKQSKKASYDPTKENIENNIQRILLLMKTANLVQKEILAKKLSELQELIQ